MTETSNGMTIVFSDAETKVLRKKYDKLTEDEFMAFLGAVQRYRLNPLANQIYARLQPQTEKNPRSVTYMAQIDGFRLIADRTGNYAGNDDAVYEGNGKQPERASVVVHKLVATQRVPFSASARWAEYCPGGNAAFMWSKMPYLMLGKCAEALALRKAFPAELSGLYTVEEMHQADEPAGPEKSTAPRKAPEKPATKFPDPPNWPTSSGEELAAWVDGMESSDAMLAACKTLRAAPLTASGRLILAKGLHEKYHGKLSGANVKQAAAVQHITKEIDALLAECEKASLDAEGEGTF